MDRIRHALVTASLFLALGSCASGTRIDRIQPDIALAQVGGSAFITEHRGNLSMEYEMTITNTTPDPLTLTSVEMKTMGGGPYLLQNAPVKLREEIPPGRSVRVRFKMWAWSPGGRAASVEPVVLSGLAWFTSSTGDFATRFVQRIKQPQSPIG